MTSSDASIFRVEASADAAALFAGPGEVRALARQLDWTSTPLGPTPGWSPALRMMAKFIFDAPFPICLWSGPEYTLIYNDAYRRILAVKHPQALGRPGSEVWAEIWDEVGPEFASIRLGGPEVYREDAPFLMARLEDGKLEPAWFNYALSALRDEEGSVAALVNITQETTGRRLLEQRLLQEQSALAMSEERLRQLNETLEAQVAARAAERDRLWNLSQDMLARADYTGMMSAVSPAWERVLGWTEQELLSRGYATFMHPEDEPATLTAIGQMAQMNQPTRFENRISTRDGGWKYIEWTVAPEPDGVNFIAVGRDISDAKAREAALVEAQTALRHSQKMEAVGQLTGGLAHDFNNILAGIGGSLELIAKRLTQGRFGDVDRYVTAAQAATRRAANLTNRLLAFSRRQTLVPKPCKLDDLVADMIDLISRSVGPHVEIETRGTAGLWHTFADVGQVENALLNLCINARDAMPDGGTIRINTDNIEVDAQTARVLMLKPGAYVRLGVDDNGHGMPRDVIERATEPFFTTKPIGQGTGLGLSMVYGFAAQSGGAVDIQSEIDRGTSVSIYLPRYQGGLPLPAEETADITLIVPEAPKTILLVDDEALIRMVVAEDLRELGYAIHDAGDAQQAMRMLKEVGKIDLLLTDVGLPNGMNGRQLADAVLRDRPDLPVIFITGYAEKAVLSDGDLGTGMRVVTKPFTSDKLAQTVQEILAGR